MKYFKYFELFYFKYSEFFLKTYGKGLKFYTLNVYFF
jgi:hypothetical protein